MSDQHKGGAIVAIERPDTSRSMSPVVSTGLAILERNPNPETLEKLLQVQEKWEANEARKAYAAALVGLTRDLPTVLARDKHVSFNTTNYTHTTLGAAVEAVKPHLLAHGFVHSWYPSSSGGEVSVTCRLTHRDGHFEAVTLTAPPDAKGGKNGAQAVASTVTMLERYTLLALLGIATADMQEPTGEQQEPVDPAQIDSQLNLRVAGNLKKYGRTSSQAEQLVGRKVQDWTRADLDRVKAWAKNAHRPECALHQGGKACDAGCDTESPPPPSGD